MLEILLLAPKNILKLDLSFELHPFEVGVLDFHRFSIGIAIVNTMGNVLIFLENQAPHFKLIYLEAQMEFDDVLGR